MFSENDVFHVERGGGGNVADFSYYILLVRISQNQINFFKHSNSNSRENVNYDYIWILSCAHQMIHFSENKIMPHKIEHESSLIPKMQGA